uniref:Uncharacterized protein n=1 Tax=Lepeophtheirus salmonis TaxID=72036 RepID=A0A0K2TZ25_LEPSM
MLFLHTSTRVLFDGYCVLRQLGFPNLTLLLKNPSILVSEIHSMERYKG